METLGCCGGYYLAILILLDFWQLHGSSADGGIIGIHVVFIIRCIHEDDVSGSLLFVVVFFLKLHSKDV
jgi:hypothetical protein